jgi:hypothetical protein
MEVELHNPVSGGIKNVGRGPLLRGGLRGGDEAFKPLGEGSVGGDLSAL